MAHPLYALSRVRERSGLSVHALAERAGLSAPTLRRLERGGMPTYATTRRLASVLRVEPETLQHLGAASECEPCEAYLRRFFPSLYPADLSG